jgi:N-methylhydantoinase B/oxoprolinase/acetone carboxylase alpha subunit
MIRNPVGTPRRRRGVVLDAMRAGKALRVIASGGGCWGDACERDAAALADGIRDELLDGRDTLVHHGVDAGAAPD